MPIAPLNKVSTPPKKRTNYVKITGYAAVVSAAASVVSAKHKKIKMHKNLAYLAGIFTLIHAGIIEWYHFNAKKR